MDATDPWAPPITLFEVPQEGGVQINAVQEEAAAFIGSSSGGCAMRNRDEHMIVPSSAIQTSNVRASGLLP